MRRARIALWAISLVWMAGAYAQSAGEFLALREKVEAHLRTAEGKIEQLGEISRRVSVLEDAARVERMDGRLARVETGLESLRTMMWGLLVPIFLMGAEVILRLISSVRKPTK